MAQATVSLVSALVFTINTAYWMGINYDTFAVSQMDAGCLYATTVGAGIQNEGDATLGGCGLWGHDNEALKHLYDVAYVANMIGLA